MQTDRQTDDLAWHNLALCVASRGQKRRYRCWSSTAFDADIIKLDARIPRNGGSGENETCHFRDVKKGGEGIDSHS